MGKRSNKGRSVSIDKQSYEVIREAVLTTAFRQDLKHWTVTQPKVAVRAWEIIENIMDTPFTGIGRPEPLKYSGADLWSRRLTELDRIV